MRHPGMASTSTDKQTFVAEVDIGADGARAGIFDLEGRLLARAEEPMVMRGPQPDGTEPDSSQICDAVCQAVHEPAQHLASLGRRYAVSASIWRIGANGGAK
jgi:ribulose kinase